MAAFRILNQFPVYLGRDNKPADGGELRFYVSGTTTPKSVYGDPGLSINNGAVIVLQSDGRPAVDIWGDGSYRVRLYDYDGTLIDEADDVEIAGGDAATIPALVDGYFLTNNGALLLWAEIRQLPDPTGQDGKMVVADGDGYILQSVPVPPDPDITIAAGSFRAGVADNDSKFFILTGTGQAGASGEWITSTNITFSQAFTALWNVLITPTTARVSTADSGYLPASSVTGWTPGSPSSGATVNFVLCEDDRAPANRFTSPVPFAWTAMGLINIGD